MPVESITQDFPIIHHQNNASIRQMIKSPFPHPNLKVNGELMGNLHHQDIPFSKGGGSPALFNQSGGFLHNWWTAMLYLQPIPSALPSLDDKFHLFQTTITKTTETLLPSLMLHIICLCRNTRRSKFY